MHRQALLTKLAAYTPLDGPERRAYERMVAFVRANPACFERLLLAGHVTASAWLLDRSGDRVLLTHHKQLGRWLQLGGHADGNGDVLSVALREAQEESGLSTITPVSTDIFDVDVHPIPAHRDMPTHEHYDVRFLLQTHGDEKYRVSDESHELAWVSPSKLPALNVDESVQRLHRKWLDRRGASLRT